LLGRRATAPGRGRLIPALVLAAAGLAPGASPAVELLTSGGPDLPPSGASLLSELFPGGLPHPFEAALDRLRALAGGENVATALIPIGRSLQRYAADPDYFASPRVVVAVTGDRAAPGSARLADRLFLGYQPASGVVEAISYDEAAGRFEFEQVVGYGGAGRLEPAERRVCTACHQGEGPIFARPLWAETNANPAVAARLAGLEPAFHGAPVRQTVDGVEDLDAATDRAARIALANRLWSEGCPDPACRAALLAAALRTAIGGAPAGWPVPAAPGFAAGRLWPDGLAAITPDLPNRNPLLTPGLETSGALNPQTPRAPVTLWHPDDGFAGAAREVSAQFAPGDLAWLDELARRRGGPEETIAFDCAVSMAGSERRFDCGRARGFMDGAALGRIDALALPGLPPAGHLAGPEPRLPDGRRIAGFALAGDRAELRLVDDLAPLAAALAAQATEAPALGPGPFRRRAVLALLAALMEATDG
jgi:hypothetical protein